MKKQTQVKRARITKMSKTVKPDDASDAMPKAKHETPFNILEAVHSGADLVRIDSADLTPPEPSDAEITEASMRSAALDRVSAAMAKIGISNTDMDIVFGIKSDADRGTSKKPNGKAK